MRKTDTALINILFFLSGFAALVYQLSWQRMLFTLFGVDLESITIVVSSFMLGLGVGALAGGRLADQFPKHCIALFVIAEAGVGVFALVSPELIQWIGNHFNSLSKLQLSILSFTFLLLPTFLMGGTLPILVSHLARKNSNVGYSTGNLYAANTLGAAFGALTTAFLLFEYLTLIGAVYLGGMMNFMAASGAAIIVSKRDYSHE